MASAIRTYSKDKNLVEERRREIVILSCHMFVENGYDKTGMRDIARAFGKSTGSLYYYVASKEDILQLILNFVVTNENEYLNEIKEKIANLNPTEALVEAIRLYIISYQEYKEMHIFLNHIMVNLTKDQRRMILDTSKNITGFFLDLVINGNEKGEFHTNNPRLVAWNITMMGNNWILRRWFWKDISIEGYIINQTELALKILDVDSTQFKLSSNDV